MPDAKIDSQWIWEDESDLSGKGDAVDDGVILLGEEGRGARWVLVLRGPQRGTEWFTTGEGAASGHSYVPIPLSKFGIDKGMRTKEWKAGDS